MPSTEFDVCVVGLGYIGLPTASLLATLGRKVAGFDVNAKVVEVIGSGAIHIEEPDLATLVKAAVSSGNLVARNEPTAASTYIITVPTPFGENKRPVTTYVEQAVASIAPLLVDGSLVINESTSPVGTTNEIASQIAALRPDLSEVHVAHSPERVLPGQILRELVSNERVVGGVTPAATDRAVEFYRSFVQGEIHASDARTAELCKLAENAFRDVNIAYANELSMLCDGLGIDVFELIDLANRHPRVNILRPGAGVGGHCIAVDPWFIVAAAPDHTPLVRTARGVNDAKPSWVVDRIRAAVKESSDPQSARVACLGLAFKPNVDDLRESPAIDIAKRLVAEFGDRVLIAEPHITEHDEFQLVDARDAVERADVVAVLVGHRAFDWLKNADLGHRTMVDAPGFMR